MKRVVRDQLVIRGAYLQLEDPFPVGAAGAVALLRNDNDNAVTLTMTDSDDGSTWNAPGQFYTVDSGPITSLVIAAKGTVIVSGSRPAKYARFNIAGVNTAGVFVTLEQFELNDQV